MSAVVGSEISTGNNRAIRTKIHQLAARCRTVSKDGYNDFHKYRYASAATIYEEVNEAMQELGLVVNPRMRLIESAVIDKRGSKGNDLLVLVECTLTVMDVETGEYLQTISYGGGQDAGDKSVMKAQTAALKYALINLILMSSGDDPEADTKTDASAAGKSKAAKQREDSPAPPIDDAIQRAERWLEVHHPNCKGTKDSPCQRSMVLRRVKDPKAQIGRRLYIHCELAASLVKEAKNETERASAIELGKAHDFRYVPKEVELGTWKP